MSRSLLSPRARGATLGDFGERSTFVADQRVGRPRRRRRAVAVRHVLRGALVVLLAAAGLAAVGAAGGLFVTSQRFAVTSVEVRGAALVSAERILEAAGIPAGRSVFLLDPRQIARQVETLPEVERAEVVRELPNRVRSASRSRSCTRGACTGSTNAVTCSAAKRRR